jgi:hypothetical protein
MFVEVSASTNYGEIWNILIYNYKYVALIGLSIRSAIYLNDSKGKAIPVTGRGGP